MAKDYAKDYFWDDFWYGFNPLNWFNGDFVGNQPSEQARKRDQLAQDKINFNKEFEDLFNNGASGDDLMRYVLEHPEAQYDSGLISSFISRADQRDLDNRNLYAENLEKMKKAGINPLVGLGSVGSLGSFESAGAVDLDTTITQAQAGSNGYNSDLANIKNILLILLAIGKLAK